MLDDLNRNDVPGTCLTLCVFIDGNLKQRLQERIYIAVEFKVFDDTFYDTYLILYIYTTADSLTQRSRRLLIRGPVRRLSNAIMRVHAQRFDYGEMRSTSISNQAYE